MGLVHDGTGTQRDWWDRNTTGHGTQRDEYTTELVHNGTGTQWDGYTLGQVHNGTGTQPGWDKTGLGQNGTETFVTKVALAKNPHRSARATQAFITRGGH